MVLVKWNPWNELFSAQRDMQDMLRRYFGEWPTQSWSAGRSGGFAPAIDVFTRGGDIVVRAELPGINPESDVDIQLQENVLTIRGERRRQEQTDGETYYRTETHYGAFQRHISVPEGIKAEDIQATYNNGILEVVVPHGAQLPEAKRIPVQVGESHKALTARGRKRS